MDSHGLFSLHRAEMNVSLFCQRIIHYHKGGTAPKKIEHIPIETSLICILRSASRDVHFDK